MSQRRTQRGALLRKGLALLLALVLSASLAVPAGAAVSASMQASLDKVVDWGVMRGDINGNLNAERTITRAEFVTMINRAFGFSKTGTTPFQDVPSTAWYAEDVGIAYTEGYINGTTDTTFSPYSSVTREQAAVIMARILMLQPTVGENTDFSDSREMGNWSRGLIAAATDYHIVSGYADGSFRPKSAITRGAAAVMIANAIGTPVQEAGDYSLGSVWGNVTITASGTTLRDTVIGGNLYISAGVDLGHVTLENVRVLGEIIICGGGASEGGDDSFILRNVDASKLVLDNMSNQLVSLRVEGDGVIQETAVRTNAYISDQTPEGYGLSKISLDSDEEDLSLSLAGNIKEVITTAPQSSINLASGQAQTITIDEKATDSSLNIAPGALAENVNLDTAVDVTGSGDIGSLNVNANGSTVSMLPDQITVRPGVTGNINGEVMDNQAAAESSADPRLSAGYPKISDLAPNSASAQFSANKKGTVYWAVTAVTDGSVEAEDLINPPSYNPLVVKQGTVSLSGSNQVSTANISGLTSDGSYYLSAIMVDARDQRSPLKVISFSTPDNTKPDFASGYPYMSKITSISGQVTAMATKTCRLYWAVLPKGASAPTASDFKANAVTGNLGFGSIDVTKNTSYTFTVNSVPLEELKSYDLYLWLTDVDGAQSSSVKKLSFTTVDGTPPVFNTNPTINSVKSTSVGLYANLNEDGTLYWVVVEHGTVYPKPVQGEGTVDLSSEAAKLQVMAGMNALKSGKVSMKQDKDVSFNVTGLEAEKSYDLYYVAQDKAGNYSASVGMIEIHTLDNNAPTVTQEFNKINGTDTTRPLSDSDVTLVFSESVQTADTYTSLQTLYDNVEALENQPGQDAAREKMAAALSNAIYLYQVPSGSQPVQIKGYDPATDGDKESADWTIDYRYAVIETKEGQTRVTFPHGTGINLRSGATYYFEIQADTIADTSSAVNTMGQTKLEQFTTVFAIVNLSPRNENTISSYVDSTGTTQTEQDIPVDLSWRLSPVTTDAVDPSIDWDMLIWSDTSVTFDLYKRVIGDDTGTWEFLGTHEIPVPDGTDGYIGASLTRHFLQNSSNNPDFDPLNTLDPKKNYEYAISFTKVAGLSDRDTWSQRLNIKVNVVAGSNDDLSFLSASPDESTWEEALNTGVTNIGQPEDLVLRKQFTDNVAPTFIGDYPDFEAGDSAVEMSLMLDRPGTVYYVVAPLGHVGTQDKDGNIYDTSSSGKDNWLNLLPKDGQNDNIDDDENPIPPVLTSPDYLNIVNASTNYRNDEIKYGSVTCGSSVEVELVEGLNKQTQYIAYFVLQGTSQTYSRVLAYRFETTDVAKPKLTLTDFSPSVKFETDTGSSADVNYALVANTQIPSQLTVPFDSEVDQDPTVKAAWETYRDSLTAGTNTTVLWALLTPYKTGYTVFDEFAGDGIRATVDEFISGGSSMGVDVATRGSLELTQANNYRSEQNFTANMRGATYYYCLATAVSPLGSEMSFAAVAGIHIRDSEPPKLMYVNTAATPDAGGKTYSGTVTFVFDEPVYQLVTSSGVDQDPKEVWQFTGPADSDAVLLLDIIGTSAGRSSFYYTNHVKSPASTLTLGFNGLPLGTTIVLFNDSYICDANSNSTRERLSFVLQTGADIGYVPGGVAFVQQ